MSPAFLTSPIVLTPLDSKPAQYKYSDVFHGYVVNLKGKDLDFIRQSKDIEFIEEDCIATIEYEQGDESSAFVERSEAPVVAGLAKCVNGSGVVGTYTASNSEFNRSYKRWFLDTAGTAVGTPYGVATSARIVAIKVSAVFSDAGSGAYSDIIAGVNWAVSDKGNSPHTLDPAITPSTGQGVHFTIAAGNNNVDTSPARVAAANTVGAVDSSNQKASFSNHGSILDVWALGVNMLNAWFGSTTTTNTISGISMAT
ncbi:subtilisin-like serine protease [Ceratobasidium sp. 414]|nr:subtilisin-like serine protease [Ceratobasidium sp. 414]